MREMKYSELIDISSYYNDKSGGSGLEYPLSMKLYPRKNRYWISRRIDKINAILNAI